MVFHSLLAASFESALSCLQYCGNVLAYIRMEVSSTEEKQVAEENESAEQALSDQEIEAGRLALRENAKRVLRDSGLAQMLQEINKNELRRRGNFEEYDSLLLLKWGTGYTRRHIWIEVKGNTIRFRLSPHRKCSSSVPICDGEYHTFTGQMWANSDLLRVELYKYYRKPVAESSDD